MNVAKTTLTPRLPQLPQFQYTRLEHQTQAVDSIARVFDNVPFVAATASHANVTQQQLQNTHGAAVLCAVVVLCLAKRI